MKKVNIQQLKSNFPAFLKELRAGHSLLLCSRNMPVAQMTPIMERGSTNRKFGQFKKFIKVDQHLFALEDQKIERDFKNSSESDFESN